MRAPIVIVLIMGPIMAAMTGCEEESFPTPIPDSQAPSAVVDLHAEAIGDPGVILTWTAPGDDGNEGSASEYEIRFSREESAGAEWWDSVAVAVSDHLSPRCAGSEENLRVGGLMPMTTYYFALRAADEASNWSELSNVVSVVSDSMSLSDMVLVPAGAFVMGDGEALCGQDEHEVRLRRGFFLGEHEVTNQEYMKALQWAFDNGYVSADTNWVWDNLDGSNKTLLDFRGIQPSAGKSCEIQFDGAGIFYLKAAEHALQTAYPSGYDPADHPVKFVSWYGAARYCDWLSLQAGLPRAYEHSGSWTCNGCDPYTAEGYRLPTDAEWEFAAQWNREHLYPWGHVAPDPSLANFGGNVGWSSPIGSYPDAVGELGLVDMAGNVREWCNDWMTCSLGIDPQTDPVGPGSGSIRVQRGGSWSLAGEYLLCASRLYEAPGFGFEDHGFRVARSISR